MFHLLDTTALSYVIVGLVLNLMVMLLAMARIHREVRTLAAKLGNLESDNRILDQGLNELSEELRRMRLAEHEQRHVAAVE